MTGSPMTSAQGASCTLRRRLPILEAAYYPSRISSATRPARSRPTLALQEAALTQQRRSQRWLLTMVARSSLHRPVRASSRRWTAGPEVGLCLSGLEGFAETAAQLATTECNRTHVHIAVDMHDPPWPRRA
jgi:hypothetical protein